MSHNHGVYDTDLHFVINPITRQITNESLKTKLVQYDHNSERFTFELPRIVEGHDMSRCTNVEIHYINIAANKVDKYEDVYPVDDLAVNYTSSDLVQFTWLISGNATQYAGSLNFLIRFACLTGDKVDYGWHTEIFSGIEIAGGMNNSETAVVEYSDVLEAWKKEVLSGIDEKLNSSISEMDKKLNNSLSELDAKKEQCLESLPISEVVRYIAGDSVVISEQTLTSGMWSKRQMDIISGIPYAVYINGKEYFCIAYEYDGGIILGNYTIANSSANVPHNNEPFYIYWAGGSATAGMFGKNSALSYPVTLKVTSATEVNENKLPEEYLPRCVVKSVNGNKPDENGNVEFETGGGTGGTSIDVTAEVGQTIVVKEIDANGKPTKWESADYQPRTHWSEVVTDLPETQLVDNGEGYFFAEEQLALTYGEEYIVTYNGVKYDCTTFIVGEDTGLGNGVLFELPDNGLPFLIIVPTGGVMVVPLDGATEVTIRIERRNYVKIPSQYIGNVGTFYIDFDVVDVDFVTDALLNTSVTSNEVIDAINLGRPIFARNDVDVFILNYMNVSNDSVSLTFSKTNRSKCYEIEFATGDNSLDDPINGKIIFAGKYV